MHAVSCGGWNSPLFSPTGFVRYGFDGGDCHPLMGSGGKSVVAVLIFELLFIWHDRTGCSPPISGR